MSGKTAYVNGVKITGEMKNNGAVSGVISKKLTATPCLLVTMTAQAG